MKRMLEFYSKEIKAKDFWVDLQSGSVNLLGNYIFICFFYKI